MLAVARLLVCWSDTWRDGKSIAMFVYPLVYLYIHQGGCTSISHIFTNILLGRLSFTGICFHLGCMLRHTK